MSPGKKTILLVEDENLIAALEKKNLERSGYEVIIVGTGEKAVETMNNTPGIDLVLMDINLGPGIDGTEAAELILNDHDVPLIFLSSHAEKEVVEKTEGITSYGYILKDTPNAVLLASVRMAFRLYETRKRELHKEELLTLFMRYSPIYAFIKEVSPEESRVLMASDNYLDMVGISGRDMVGKNMFELFPEDLAKSMTADDQQVVGEGKVLRIREALNGRQYDTYKFPITIGNRTLLAGYTIDVTDLIR